MGIFSFFKKKPALKVQRLERPGIKLRLKNTKKLYEAEVALVYKGKPMRQFKVTDKGYSRDKVADSINNELTLKLISVKQIKNKS